MRTFSKAYGLAGIRVAYTVGHKEVLQYINRVRGPFNVSSLAQVAAMAAIEDDEFLKKLMILISKAKTSYTKSLID